MKYILIIIFFFFNTFIYAQSSEEFEKRAIAYESKRNYFGALELYNYIKLRDSLNPIGIRASNKIKALLPLVANELNGKWRLKQTQNEKTMIKFTELLEIKEGEVRFLQIKEGKSKVVDIIKLNLVPYSPTAFFDFPKIKLENGEIWVLSFRTINNEKRLVWQQKINKAGEFILSIDDRGIIIDTLKRKKALEGEIHTYYVLEN